MNESHTQEMFVEVVGAADGFLPGQRLQANLLWALPEVPKLIEARLFWRTRGKGTEDAEVVDSHRIDRPAAAGKETISLMLPEAPYSFSGRLVSIVWGVELIAEPSGTSALAEFVMGPDRKEVVLNAVLNAPGT
jgi:hypothetical protein